MSDSVSIHVEKTDVGFWTYLKRSAGDLPATPLFQVVNWILEQLNLGNFKAQRDHCGDVVSLILGRDAAREALGLFSDQQSIDSCVAEAERRLFAVNVAGVMAQSRESGIRPELEHLSTRVSQSISDWGLRNTEFHYAFELNKVLARLNKKTFNLEAPPIAGLAPTSVVSYLRESTKCWMYGFHGASVALSRACLEDALKVRIQTAGSHSPQLDCLIDEATRGGLLDDCMAEVAHTIRRTANKFLHGQGISEKDSRETLDAIRGIVKHLFSS